MYLPRVFLLLGLLAPAGFADTLSDAKSALHRLGGLQPMKVTLDLHRSRHSKGKFLSDDFDGSAVVEAEIDGTVVRTTYSRALVDRAEDEEWARDLDPERTAPTSEALSEALPVAIDNTIDSAKPLLRLLVRGTVTSQRVEGANRVIVLRLPASGKGAQGGRLTYTDDVLTMWVDRNGYPQRTMRVRHGYAGFLFIKVSTVRTETSTYAVRGDHLLTMQSDDHALVDGPGQHGEARTTWVTRKAELREKLE
jgi:hypothetical protein